MADKKMSEADLVAAANLRAIWDRKKNEKKLTQGWAAEQLNMSDSGVSAYLNGKMPLGVQATLRWAKLLDVEPSDIRHDFDELLGRRPNPLINASVLNEVMVAVEELHDELGITLPTDQRAKLISIAYDEAIKDGAVDREGIRKMMIFAM